ncbi:hypothetical protein [Micromonospora rosaria]|uniref:hypothetical protein n=2 Tax=Micromonospora rosaria TaxID=47874 RepID=UPI0037C639B9
MPVLRRLGEPTGLAAPGDAAGPALERIVPFTFTEAGPPPVADELAAFLDHMESLYGTFADRSWLTDGPKVSYHHMVRTVVDTLGPALADVDLVLTVDASPDCRHQSFPGSLLAELLPGDPMMMGISEQGVAGPFTALRIAHHQLTTGGARRALVVVMEQQTLPPDDAAVRPTRDVAVALLLGPDGGVPVGRPQLTVTRGGPADPAPPVAADLVVAGAGLDDPPAGVPVVRAPAGHPCLGVWLALAGLLGAEPLSGDAPGGVADPARPLPVGREPLPGGRVLVTDRDPTLPYRCGITLTLPAPPRADVPARAGRARSAPVRSGAAHPPAPASPPPGPAAGVSRPRRTRELTR